MDELVGLILSSLLIATGIAVSLGGGPADDRERWDALGARLVVAGFLVSVLAVASFATGGFR